MSDNATSWLQPNIVFILGSGFSRAFHDSMPLTSGLHSYLDPTTRTMIEDEGYTNILEDFESLFSMCFSDYPWLIPEEKFRLRALYYRLSARIARGLYDTMSSLPITAPSHMTNLASFWEDRRSYVITFNYDTIVERLLPPRPDRDDNDLWKLTMRGLDHRFSGGLIGGGPPRQDGPTLIKLHGSINWWHSGDFEDHSEEIYYGDARRNDVVVADLVQMLIPPTIEKTQFYRHRIIQLLWRRARFLLDTAQIVVVIGYSLPPSDTPIRLLMRQTLRGKNIIFVNPSTSQSFRRDIVGFFESAGATLNQDYFGVENAVGEFINEELPTLRGLKFH